MLSLRSWIFFSLSQTHTIKTPFYCTERHRSGGEKGWISQNKTKQNNEPVARTGRDYISNFSFLKNVVILPFSLPGTVFTSLWPERQLEKSQRNQREESYRCIFEYGRREEVHFRLCPRWRIMMDEDTVNRRGSTLKNLAK